MSLMSSMSRMIMLKQRLEIFEALGQHGLVWRTPGWELLEACLLNEFYLSDIYPFSSFLPPFPALLLGILLQLKSPVGYTYSMFFSLFSY